MTLVKNTCDVILTTLLFLTGIGSIIIRDEERRAEDYCRQNRASADETETREKA